jgi:hypothetical protein
MRRHVASLQCLYPAIRLQPARRMKSIVDANELGRERSVHGAFP